MIAGNIGSSSIMSYTVIGDNVNLGSRLESLNKEYKTRIIMSDATRSRLDGTLRHASARATWWSRARRGRWRFSKSRCRPRSARARNNRHEVSSIRPGRPSAWRPRRHAQLGGLDQQGRRRRTTPRSKYDDLNITDAEERQLGEQVSPSLARKYGVYQDKDVTKYVSLLGGVLAQQSSRPDLKWKFIVLDTDGVNAFAAPGGLIHVTRGLLGLAKNEAELAGVLGHEITHVTAKHTVRAIQKSKGISMGSDQVGGSSLKSALIAKMAEKAYHLILDGEFSREDENEADKVGVAARQQGRLRTVGPGRSAEEARRAQHGP